MTWPTDSRSVQPLVPEHALMVLLCGEIRSVLTCCHSMHLSDLDDDVSHLIFFNLCSTADRNALSLTSRRFKKRLLPYLYDHVSLSRDSAQVHSFCDTLLNAADGRIAALCIHSLGLTRSAFYQRMRQPLVTASATTELQAADFSFATPLSKALLLMTSLWQIVLADHVESLFAVGPEIPAALRNLAKTLSRVKLAGVGFRSTDMLYGLRNLEVVSLASCVTTRLESVLLQHQGFGKAIFDSRETLEELSFTYIPLHSLLTPQPIRGLPDPIWPRVRSLSIDFVFVQSWESLATSFPSLQSLETHGLYHHLGSPEADPVPISFFPHLTSITGSFPALDKLITPGRLVRRIAIHSGGGSWLREKDETILQDPPRPPNIDRYLEMVGSTSTRSLQFNVLGDITVSFFARLARAVPCLTFLSLEVGETSSTEGTALLKLFEIGPILGALPLTYLHLTHRPFTGRRRGIGLIDGKHSRETCLMTFAESIRSLQYLQLDSRDTHWGCTCWRVLNEDETDRREVIRMSHEDGQRLRRWYEWSG